MTLANLLRNLLALSALLSAGAALIWILHAVGRRRRPRSGEPPRFELPASAGPPRSPGECLRRYVQDPGRYCCSEEVTLLVDGQQAFPAMLAAIDGAQTAVDLEAYIVRADTTGGRFQQAMIRAAQRGVRVRLTYDWIGSLGLGDDFVRPLIEADVEVRVYHPLALSRPIWAMNRRTHRKILVVDGRLTFTGGLNISDDNVSIDAGGKGWHDTHIRIVGDEAAGQMLSTFEYAWRRATPYAQSATRVTRLRAGVRQRLARLLRRRSHAAPSPGRPYATGVPVKILGNEEFRFRQRIRRAYLHAIDAAERYVLIENAYFIPSGQIRRAMLRAVRRGVAVAVVVARHSDVPLTTYAMRHVYGELLSGGVRIFEWPDGMMHAKTAVIDDAWSIVGSYNFDHRSLIHQLEVVAVVADPAIAQGLGQQTLADTARCLEVALWEHNRRPWQQRVLEVLAYWVRNWL